MAISDPGRGLVRRLGVTAAALFAFAAASQQRAEALSLASPGTAPSAKFATDGLTTEVRHGGHGGGGRRRWWFPRWWRWWLPRRRWWLSRRRVSWRRLQRRRCCVPWRRVQRRWHCDPSWRLSRRARVPRRRHRYGYRHVYHRPHFHHRHHFHRRFYAPSLLRISVLLWLPAPLLPRDLDLLRAAQDLQISPVVSAPLASPLLRNPLLVSAEMKQAPGGAPVFISGRRISLLNPSPCRATA